MDLEIVKRAIYDAIPNNVKVSNVDIKESNGQLSVQISWKASEPTLEVYPNNNWWAMDGYCRPLINFDQQVPTWSLDDRENLSSAYREKMKADFEKSEQEANQLRKVKAAKDIDTRNAKSICEAEDARILAELAKKVTDAVENPTTTVREVQTPEGRVVKRISIPKEVNVVAVKGTDQYEKALIRAGIDPLMAKKMACDADDQFTFNRLKPLDCNKHPKTTAEGKLVTPIDLPLPTQEPRVPSPNTKEEVAEFRKKNYPGAFRSAEPDNYTAVIADGKLKVIDGYQRLRKVKNALEVVAEYKKAVEAYDKRFANVRSHLSPKPNAADKGKRAVPALTVNSLPFSHKDRKVTDVEVMFMANEKMAKLTDPTSLMDDLKALEVKLPPLTKFKRILFHLRSIKNEILRK